MPLRTRRPSRVGWPPRSRKLRAETLRSMSKSMMTFFSRAVGFRFSFSDKIETSSAPARTARRHCFSYIASGKVPKGDSLRDVLREREDLAIYSANAQLFGDR